MVQNAEDLRASELRILVRQGELLLAHNGASVRLPDVLALATPWLTTKAEDAEATGRFGIGLMTLRAISPVLEVHCGHYHAQFGDPTISVVDALTVPPEFASQDWTVLRIPLTETSSAADSIVTADDIDRWLGDWSDSALLFLRYVTRIVLYDADLRTRRELRLERGRETGGVLRVAGDRQPVRRQSAVSGDGTRWMRFTAVVPTPQGVSRAYKATAETITVSVAIPRGGTSRGHVHVGLPVVATGLPLRVSAPFDPVPSRRGIADNAWNRALADIVAELWTAVVLRMFSQSPKQAWQVMPLDLTDQSPSPLVTRLEAVITEQARTEVSRRLTLAVPGGHEPLGLADLALEEAELTSVLTCAEVAQVAGCPAALPDSARDAAGRWRAVLADWSEAGGKCPVPVSVADAMVLLNDQARSPEATLALAAVCLEDGWSAGRLTDYRWIIDDQGARHRPPGESAAWVFAEPSGELAEILGIARRLHPAYRGTSPEAQGTRAWLRRHGALLTGSGSTAVIRRLAAVGAAGRQLSPEALSDEQVKSLRDGFVAIPDAERPGLGRDVGRAVLLEAYQYDSDGKPRTVAASPADAYLPRALDSTDRDGFAFAAGATPGTTWLRSRYAEVLQGSGTGLGATRFMRLLGAASAPRLRPHPSRSYRFSQAARGVPRWLEDNSSKRFEDLLRLRATYTLEDYDSPDLQAVAEHIASESDAALRRSRAVALVDVLARAWQANYADHAEVEAVSDYYTWQKEGTTAASWLWRLRETKWLEDEQAELRSPLELRLRTRSTAVVYGNDGAKYLHHAIQGPLDSRAEVLEALGVAGDASVSDLIARLVTLRDSPGRSGPEIELDTAATATIVYSALAQRLPTATRDVKELTEIQRAFDRDNGLILTQSGWRKPAECLQGPPIFGRLRDFAPVLPEGDLLWSRLGVKLPSADDACAVIRDVARTENANRRAEPDAATHAVLLESLNLLAREATREGGRPSSEARPTRLPLWTSMGWTGKRPVYAVQDPSIADALAPQLPVWRPGAELQSFQPLLEVLRITQLEMGDMVVKPSPLAQVDLYGTHLAREAVALLREDLQRNSPAIATALTCSWAELSELTVQVDPDLRRVIKLPLDGQTVEVTANAAIDRDAGVFYVREIDLLARPSTAGRAIAGQFTRGQREVANAWPAAWDQAQAGARPIDLDLAAQQTQRQQEAADAVRQQRLRELAEEASVRREKLTPKPSLPAQGGTAASSSAVTWTSQPPRALVDPNRLVLEEPQGRVTGSPTAAPATSSPSEPRTRAVLPQPRQHSAATVRRTGPRSFTTLEQEKVALDLVRRALSRDDDDLRDLRGRYARIRPTYPCRGIDLQDRAVRGPPTALAAWDRDRGLSQPGLSGILRS
ncbi:sacsin N-terminal ATP-binding-like domain-containing protein [Kitasatospora sp. NBC_01266]|uniref:sacsin N-terminal ATP-binding-like domain-containing protein n=1 Tax=Kitasatospora sp. NBC_01266 TaxID=2903572 RepID=UPI002E317A2D|nr:hypothetical protein [Kitasatospora sp. NBC_01266]